MVVVKSKLKIPACNPEVQQTGMTSVYEICQKSQVGYVLTCQPSVYEICQKSQVGHVKEYVRGTVGKFPDCSWCVICFQRRTSKLRTLVEKTFFCTTIYTFRGFFIKLPKM